MTGHHSRLVPSASLSLSGNSSVYPGYTHRAMVHATASRHIELLLSPSDEAIELMLRTEMKQLGDLRDRYEAASFAFACVTKTVAVRALKSR